MNNRSWYLRPYVLVAVFISATAFAMVLLTLLLLPQTGEIMSVMQWRMINADTFRIDTSIDYRGWVTRVEEDSTVRDRETFILQTSGYVDRSDEAETNQRHLFQLSASPKAGDNQIVYKFEGETRTIKDATFLQLNRIPQTFGTFRLDRFAKRWLRIDLTGILARFDLPLVGGGFELSDEDRQYLLEEFRLTPFLAIERPMKNESIGGVSTYHYEIKPEMLFVKDFFVTSETLRRGRELNAAERQSIDKLFNNLKAENGEIWISHGDYYLRRILLRFKYDDGERDSLLTMTATFSDFNQPVTVDGPTGEVQNINDIVRSLLPGIVNRLPLAQTGGQNTVSDSDNRPGGLPIDEPVGADQDSDGDGLPNALEFFYGCDAHNPDSDGDGQNDGAEIDAGQNPNGSGGLFDFGLSARLNGYQPTDNVSSDTGTTAAQIE
ncbi:MAG: hypothetical protein V1738_03760 [Patescibacteria group bacterium]